MPPDPDQLLAYISETIQRKQYGHADTILRSFLLDVGPRPDTYTMLAQLAFTVGEQSTARRFLNQAVALAPAFTPASQGLKKLGADRMSLDQQSSAAKRFLLIRAWGQGFWSDVSHVIGGMMLAEHTNRTPVVWWGQDSRYTTPDTVNAWTHYFEPVSSVTLETLATERSFWPAKWNSTNLGGASVNLWSGAGSRTSLFDLVNRAERVAVADFHLAPSTVHFYMRADNPLAALDIKAAQRRVLSTHLRPTMAIQQRVNALRARHGAPVGAMHLRWTDKITEDLTLADLHARAEPWAREVLARHPGGKILVMTDSHSVAADWRARLGEAAILCDVQRSGDDRTGTHFQNFDGLALGEDILTESLFALQAQHFLGSINSNVSNMIYLLKDWEPGSTTFTGTDSDSIVNFAIFNPAVGPIDRFKQK